MNKWRTQFFKKFPFMSANLGRIGLEVHDKFEIESFIQELLDAQKEEVIKMIEEEEKNFGFNLAILKDKILSRKLVVVAIRNGGLIPKPCEVCGAKRVEGHHTDYSKPLEVRWLCDLHHQQLHRNIISLNPLYEK